MAYVTDERLIEAILKAKPPDEVDARWIANELRRIEQIQDRIIERERELLAAEKRIAETKRRIATEKRVIQETCPHYSTRYCGDAAGGSDSFTRCNICDAEF